MARIVFTTWGSLGDLHPYLALALELKRRGHDAVVATVPTARDHVERAGLEFRQIRPDVPTEDPASREVVRQILDVRRGAEFLFKRVLAPHLRETCDDTLSAVQGAGLLVSHQLPSRSRHQRAVSVALRSGLPGACRGGGGPVRAEAGDRDGV